ncbi:MAG: hypothetical protein K2L37_02675, partial [Lactobacillus sp.]|nr:hypothetical protein [Lactobacillus sp.]
ILNMFYGVVVNAARAVAIQVQNAVGRFVGDFMTALNPQITKEYAAGNREKSVELCNRGAKLSYYIMLILAIPIGIRAGEILHLWLDEYPDFSVPFLRFTLAISMVGVLSQSFVTELLASGNLKKTTWWIGGTRLIVLPMIYACFVWFDSPLYAYIVVLVMDTILFFVRLRLLDDVVGLPVLGLFMREVFIRVFIVSLTSFLFSMIAHMIVPTSIWGMLLYGIVSVACTSGCLLLFGLNKAERVVIRSYVMGKFNGLKWRKI